MNVGIVRNVISVSKVTSLWDRSLKVFCKSLCLCLFVGQAKSHISDHMPQEPQVSRISLRCQLGHTGAGAGRQAENSDCATFKPSDLETNRPSHLHIYPEVPQSTCVS